MRTRSNPILSFLIGLAILMNTSLICLASADKETKAIVDAILRLKDFHEARLQEGETKLRYAAFFDFDGTIIKGDITEGDKELYVGLAEKAVKEGLARDYAGDDGFLALTAKYEELLAQSHEKAYVFVAEQFANLGNEQKRRLRKLVTEHFQSTLYKHIFVSSLTYINELSKAGIDVYIVSASPEVFVKGAVTCLPQIPLRNMSGINRQRNEKKRLLCPIVNYGQGKILRIRHLISQLPEKAIAIAGFGNSWSTDGPFLKWIRNEGGISVMINGGKKPNDTKGIWLVRQEKTLREK